MSQATVRTGAARRRNRGRCPGRRRLRRRERRGHDERLGPRGAQHHSHAEADAHDDYEHPAADLIDHNDDSHDDQQQQQHEQSDAAQLRRRGLGLRRDLGRRDERRLERRHLGGRVRPEQRRQAGLELLPGERLRLGRYFFLGTKYAQ
jgi:hypothetical protein